MNPFNVQKFKPESEDRSRGWVTFAHPGRGVHMRRWRLLPWNRWCNLYVHVYVTNDPGPPHDHPYDFVSLTLRGSGEEEVVSLDDSVMRFKPVVLKRLRFYRAEHVHRISRVDRLITVMIHGPRRHDWGFVETMEKPS